MFIKELNKKEALAFIGLVKHLVGVDCVIAEEEDRLLEEYIVELCLDEEIIRFINIKEAIKELSFSMDRTKNIIYFELLGLALVDGDFNDKEIESLNYIARAFNISKDKEQKYLDYFREMKISYDSLEGDVSIKIKTLEEKAMTLIG